MAGQKQGMDPGAARAQRDSMRAQIDGLAAIVAELTSTNLAALNPAAWGIAPGEPTVAPWSIGSITAAQADLRSAESAARTLLQRITTEADAQEAASEKQERERRMEAAREAARESARQAAVSQQAANLRGG